MRSGAVTTAVMRAPGVVLPSDTLVHGAQPSPAFPDVVKTPPPGSARNSVTRFVALRTAVTGPPGIVLPSDTLVQGVHP
jgi:hypothetical protein